MWTIYIRRPCSALRCLFFDGVGSLWIRSLNHYYSQCQIFNKDSIFLSLQLSTLHIARLWTEKKKRNPLRLSLVLLLLLSSSTHNEFLFYGSKSPLIYFHLCNIYFSFHYFYFKLFYYHFLKKKKKKVILLP